MKKIYLTQSAAFTAAHSHDGALNEPKHEHRFSYEVTFYGPLNNEGFLIDFRDIQRVLHAAVDARLNGADLNTLFTHPTTENLAVWIFDTVRAQLPELVRVRVYEAPDRWADYSGETVCR